jgi:hypothetical protein
MTIVVPAQTKTPTSTSTSTMAGSLVCRDVEDGTQPVASFFVTAIHAPTSFRFVMETTTPGSPGVTA